MMIGCQLGIFIKSSLKISPHLRLLLIRGLVLCGVVCGGVVCGETVLTSACSWYVVWCGVWWCVLCGVVWCVVVCGETVLTSACSWYEALLIQKP